jgi:hypothetical protein
MVTFGEPSLPNVATETSNQTDLFTTQTMRYVVTTETRYNPVNTNFHATTQKIFTVNGVKRVWILIFNNS